MAMIWFVFAIFFFVVEAVSLGLTTMWFLAGALVACLLAAVGVPLWLQVFAFALISAVLLLFLRPFVKKYINANHSKTNTEAWIGRRVMVTKKVSGRNVEPGEAVFNGMPWLAKSEADWITIKKGEAALIAEIEGATLILIPDTSISTPVNDKEDPSWSFC